MEALPYTARWWSLIKTGTAFRRPRLHTQGPLQGTWGIKFNFRNFKVSTPWPWLQLELYTSTSPASSAFYRMLRADKSWPVWTASSQEPTVWFRQQSRVKLMSSKRSHFFLQISLIPLMVLFFPFLSSCSSDFPLISTSRNNDCNCYCNKKLIDWVLIFKAELWLKSFESTGSLNSQNKFRKYFMVISAN